jgi:hypothetical protein
MVTRRRDARQSKGTRAAVVRAALASVAIGIALAPPAASQAPPADRVELVDATAAAGISFEHL